MQEENLDKPLYTSTNFCCKLTLKLGSYWVIWAYFCSEYLFFLSFYQLGTLHMEAGRGPLSRVKSLVHKGADIKQKDNSGVLSICETILLHDPKKDIYWESNN